MSGLLATILFLHIAAGIFGIIFLTNFLLNFFKEGADFSKLTRISFFAFLSFVISWVLGGYYYLNYYGKFSKPIILKGDFAWAHKVLMETKEHVFLFLPFLALSIFLLTWAGAGKSGDRRLKTAVGFLAFLAQSVALAVTVFGYLISGAVGK